MRARIRGRVQGVWYRGWTVEQATRLGIDGWVRNRADGSVEAVFSGSASAVGQLLDACRIGPPAARVASVDVVDEAAPATPGFRELPSL